MTTKLMKPAAPDLTNDELAEYYDPLIGELRAQLSIDPVRCEFKNRIIENDFLQSRRDRDRRAMLIAGFVSLAVVAIGMVQDVIELFGPGYLSTLILRSIASLTLIVCLAAVIRGYRRLHLLTAICVITMGIILVNNAIVRGATGGLSPADHLSPWIILTVGGLMLLPTTYSSWRTLVVFCALGVVATLVAFFPETPVNLVIYSSVPSIGAVMVFAYLSRRESLHRHEQYAALRISELLSRRLASLASTDPLTGAANRRQFETIAHKELSRAQRGNRPLALLMIDIDHFKQINDRYGHGPGDAVLRALVAHCDTHLRDIDLLARVGGEEFAVLLPETDNELAHTIAERIRSALANLVVAVDRNSITFTVSIGVATLSKACDTIEALVEVADKALYQAKNAGRNCVMSASC